MKETFVCQECGETFLSGDKVKVSGMIVCKACANDLELFETDDSDEVDEFVKHKTRIKGWN
jgi:transcription elongation factor Elf1